MDISTSGDSMIQRKSFQNQKEQEFYSKALRSICAKCGKDPADLCDFPINTALWSQFTRDCLWASFGPGKNHEDFKANGVEQKLQSSAITVRTQSCIQYEGVAGRENISLVKNHVAE